jgi:hypothetical protein
MRLAIKKKLVQIKTGGKCVLVVGPGLKKLYLQILHLVLIKLHKRPFSKLKKVLLKVKVE